MIAFWLWLLATIDAAFIGYREAAGRSALIDKRKYYLKAMLRGALFGQAAVLIVAVFIAIAVFFSSEPAVFIDELQKIGARMLVVYIPFALIIILAFIVRLYPSVDIKSITSTVIFGPFTLLRPLVAIGGVVYGIYAEANVKIFLLGVLILALMLGLERIIGSFRELNWLS